MWSQKLSFVWWIDSCENVNVEMTAGLCHHEAWTCQEAKAKQKPVESGEWQSPKSAISDISPNYAGFQVNELNINNNHTTINISFGLHWILGHLHLIVVTDKFELAHLGLTVTLGQWDLTSRGENYKKSEDSPWGLFVWEAELLKIITKRRCSSVEEVFILRWERPDHVYRLRERCQRKGKC
jgi:hypothetical protein